MMPNYRTPLTAAEVHAAVKDRLLVQYIRRNARILDRVEAELERLGPAADTGRRLHLMAQQEALCAMLAGRAPDINMIRELFPSAEVPPITIPPAADPELAALADDPEGEAALQELLADPEDESGEPLALKVKTPKSRPAPRKPGKSRKRA